MRVLVTGHLGYLGSAVVAELCRQGHDVVGFDARCYALSQLPKTSDTSLLGAEAQLNAALDIPNVEKDVRDVETSDLAGFDAVVHLAGLSNDPLGAFDEALTLRINRDMAVSLAKRCRQAGVRRFVFASSCSVYGAQSGELLTETSPTNPVTAYARAKLQAEEQISALAGPEFSPCYMRSGTVYGATPHMRFDLVVNNLSAWAIATGHVRLKSDGQAWRPIVHVCDVARSFAGVLNLNEDDLNNQVFNVAVPDGNLRIMDIARRIEAALPDSQISFAGDIDADRRDYMVSGDKIDQYLSASWRQIAFSEGLPGLVQRLSQSPIAPDVFEGVPFKRLSNLKQQISAGILDRDLRRVGTS